MLTLMRLNLDNFGDCCIEDPDVAVTRSIICCQGHSNICSTHPFSSPPNARARRAVARLGEKPKISMLRPVPARPVKRMGFLPNLSLIRPQSTLVENSAKAKAEVTIPAYMAFFLSSLVIWKDDTI